MTLAIPASPGPRSGSNTSSLIPPVPATPNVPNLAERAEILTPLLVAPVPSHPPSSSTSTSTVTTATAVVPASAPSTTTASSTGTGLGRFSLGVAGDVVKERLGPVVELGCGLLPLSRRGGGRLLDFTLLRSGHRLRLRLSLSLAGSARSTALGPRSARREDGRLVELGVRAIKVELARREHVAATATTGIPRVTAAASTAVLLCLCALWMGTTAASASVVYDAARAVAVLALLPTVLIRIAAVIVIVIAVRVVVGNDVVGLCDAQVVDGTLDGLHGRGGGAHWRCLGVGSVDIVVAVGGRGRGDCRRDGLLSVGVGVGGGIGRSGVGIGIGRGSRAGLDGSGGVLDVRWDLDEEDNVSLVISR